MDDLKTLVDIVGTLVTSAAVVAGGLWAYFHFVKGRTYRPRLEVDLSGEWMAVDGSPYLRARVGVGNIGASVVNLRQRGTGLRVSVPAGDQDGGPAAIGWRSLCVFPILMEHNWIEPGETVYDDLLLDLATPGPVLTMFEARLVWTWSKRQGNVVVFARKIIPAEPAPTRAEKEAVMEDQAREDDDVTNEWEARKQPPKPPVVPPGVVGALPLTPPPATPPGGLGGIGAGPGGLPGAGRVPGTGAGRVPGPVYEDPDTSPPPLRQAAEDDGTTSEWEADKKQG